MIDVLHVSHSYTKGGAARAAYRIHLAIRQCGAKSRMIVNHGKPIADDVYAPTSFMHRVSATVRPHLLRPLSRIGKNIEGLVSFGLINSTIPSHISKLSPKVVHLHWVNFEMLSISDISRIRQPIIWTLHDMWPMCGIEHYNNTLSWANGYRLSSTSMANQTTNWNRIIWMHKKRTWTTPITIVSPSRWLAQCSLKSELMNNWPVKIIPNAIDTNAWKPIDKMFARELLGLPQDIPILLFGAHSGSDDKRKGFDYLVKSLEYIKNDSELKDLQLLVFGERNSSHNNILPFPCNYTGYLYDELSLRIAYNAANLMVIPSILDNLPNTGLEAQSCGVPIVAFNVGGLSDIVQHKKTGFLARPFDAQDLARGIEWIIKSRNPSLAIESRQRAVHLWSNDVIGSKYRDLYDELYSS